MGCPFKYHPTEIWYKDAHGTIYESNQIWFQIADDYGRHDGKGHYVNNKDETVISFERENKEINMCDWRKLECVGEDICPMMKK